MKIAIVGSREFSDKKFAQRVIMKELLFAIPTEDEDKDQPTLVSGGAKGIDALAEKEADKLRIDKSIYRAKWKDLSHPDAVIKTGKYGKYDAMAGFRRNQLIVDKADKVVAFWNGKSNGTKDTIDRAVRAGKPIDIYIRSSNESNKND